MFTRIGFYPVAERLGTCPVGYTSYGVQYSSIFEYPVKFTKKTFNMIFMIQ